MANIGFRRMKDSDEDVDRRLWGACLSCLPVWASHDEAWHRRSFIRGRCVPIRRFKWSAALVVPVVALATLATPQAVRAECPYVVIPPATEAARTARQIIVGTVVENVNESVGDFRLRIHHVLRGPARVGDVRRFKAVFPGWPPSDFPLPDGRPFMPCEPIPGWKGNVIAFLLDALAPDGETRYNAASWINGRVPLNWEMPRTTLAEMRRLAALPPTDTVVSAVTQPDRGTTTTLVAIGLVSFVVLVVSFPGRQRARARYERARDGPPPTRGQ